MGAAPIRILLERSQELAAMEYYSLSLLLFLLEETWYIDCLSLLNVDMKQVFEICIWGRQWSVYVALSVLSSTTVTDDLDRWKVLTNVSGK